MSETDAGQGQVPPGEGPGSGGHAEGEARRAEAAEPRGRRRAGGHRFSWRTPVAALLIILGCVLAPLSVLGVWTASQVSDNSRYVANVTPLIKDPAIQNALTNKITNEIVAKINVKGLTDQAAADLSQKGFTRVGSLLQGVSGSLTSGVRAADRGGGASRPDLRLLGPPDRRSDHRHRRPAACRAWPHRADRQAPHHTTRPRPPPPVGDSCRATVSRLR